MSTDVALTEQIVLLAIDVATCFEFILRGVATDRTAVVPQIIFFLFEISETGSQNASVFGVYE